MPDLPRDRLGRGAVVAGQHPDLEPERLELRDRLARFRLERVGDGDQAGQSAPSTATYIGVAPAARKLAAVARPAVRADRPLAPSARGCRARRRVPSTVAWMPLPVIAWKSSAVGSSRPSSRARATIASPSGCSEPTSAAAASRSSVALGEAVGRRPPGSRPACRGSACRSCRARSCRSCAPARAPRRRGSGCRARPPCRCRP